MQKSIILYMTAPFFVVLPLVFLFPETIYNESIYSAVFAYLCWVLSNGVLRTAGVLLLLLLGKILEKMELPETLWVYAIYFTLFLVDGLVNALSFLAADYIVPGFEFRSRTVFVVITVLVSNIHMFLKTRD